MPEQTLVKIDQDLIAAQKAKDEARVSVLRMLKTAFKDKEIELKRELKDQEVTQILRSQLKSRQDSIEQFKKGGRDDLVKNETKEVEIIREYLPRGLDEKELEKIVVEAIAQAKAQSKQDMGKVMPIAIKKVQGRAGGEEVKNMVLQKLS